MPDDRTGLAPAEQGTVSWLGQSSSVMDLVGRFLNIKQHQKNQAMQELESTVKLSQAGFPIDPKTFSKLVKKSGLPIATDEKTLGAFYGTQNQPMGKEGQQTPGGQQQSQGQSQGPQAMQVPPGTDPYMTKAIEAHNRVATTGKALEPGEMVAAQINAMGSRALKLMNTNATTEQQKADNSLTVQQLVGKSLAGDNQARGRLMANGQIPFDFHYESWTSMTDKQKADMMDVAAGHESESQKITRATNIAESLMSSGRVTSPSSAMKIGRILADGGEVPPELRSQEKPFTFNDLKDQTLLAVQLQEMGVPSDRIGHVVSAAMAGGLENALPGNMGPSFNERRLALEGSRLEMEKLRFTKEVEIAARMSAAEARKNITDAQRAQLEEFKSYYEIARAMYGKEGKQLPEDLRKAMITRTANALGMNVEEVNTFWHFLTGGTELKLRRPQPSDETKSLIDQSVEGEKPNVPPGVGQYLRGIQP